jgi:hypothetical protein
MGGAVDLADAIYTLQYLFLSGPGPCRDAMDSNDDGRVDIGDAVYLLVFLFVDGPAPAVPFPYPGIDPTSDAYPECTCSS